MAILRLFGLYFMMTMLMIIVGFVVEGDYKDIIYTYGHVKFASEENAQGEIPLKFDYDVKVNPNNVDTTSIDFRNYIGDILVEVVEKQLEDGTIRFQK